METIITVITNIVELLTAASGMPNWLSWFLVVLVVVLVGGALVVGATAAAVIGFVRLIPVFIGYAGGAALVLAALLIGIWFTSGGVTDNSVTNPHGTSVEEDNALTAPKVEMVYDDEAINAHRDTFIDDFNSNATR